MQNEWATFVQAIQQELEPPPHGLWGRHMMEILFAAEQSSITGEEVFLESGPGWFTQTSGTPVNIHHGWI